MYNYYIHNTSILLIYKIKLLLLSYPTVARFAGVRIEDSSFNRFALNSIQRYFFGWIFFGGIFVGGILSGYREIPVIQINHQIDVELIAAKLFIKDKSISLCSVYFAPNVTNTHIKTVLYSLKDILT